MLNRNDHGQAALEFYDKRRRWADFICEMGGLSDRAFRVGFWLAKKMNGDDQSCWYRHAQIAKALGMSVDKVARALMELEARNVLVITRKHRQANLYSIRLPFEMS